MNLDTTLPDELYEVADHIQEALERAAGNGLTRSEAARKGRTDYRSAATVLSYLVAHEYATDDDRGAWTRYYAKRWRWQTGTGDAK